MLMFLGQMTPKGNGQLSPKFGLKPDWSTWSDLPAKSCKPEEGIKLTVWPTSLATFEWFSSCFKWLTSSRCFLSLVFRVYDLILSMGKPWAVSVTTTRHIRDLLRNIIRLWLWRWQWQANHCEWHFFHFCSIFGVESLSFCVEIQHLFFISRIKNYD